MKEQTGLTYEASQHLKMLAVSGAKEGKTSFLISSILGALPWQKYGGIVTKPDHLHVLTFDASAMGGVGSFITKSCGKPEDYLGMRVYNFEQDTRSAYAEGSDWDYSLFNSIVATVTKVASHISKGGVHAVMASSITGMAQAMQRGIAGSPAEDKKGSGMDASKWQALYGQLAQIQNSIQALQAHVFWEAHVDRTPDFMGGKGGEGPKETIQVAGKAGRWWPFNTEQVVRLRREHGSKVGLIDKVHMDTRPSAEFLNGGRNFTERLNQKEYDLTEVALKLGLKVGRFGAPQKKEEAAK